MQQIDCSMKRFAEHIVVNGPEFSNGTAADFLGLQPYEIDSILRGDQATDELAAAYPLPAANLREWSQRQYAALTAEIGDYLRRHPSVESAGELNTTSAKKRRMFQRIRAEPYMQELDALMRARNLQWATDMAHRVGWGEGRYIATTMWLMNLSPDEIRQAREVLDSGLGLFIA